jgi:pimeloyl-ACP methyl ester carboxylesterase
LPNIYLNPFKAAAPSLAGKPIITEPDHEAGSTQVSDGHDMDHYADDLAALTAHLDLKNAIHVGHSTGGGEVAHYLGRHGESRVAKAARARQGRQHWLS